MRARSASRSGGDSTGVTASTSSVFGAITLGIDMFSGAVMSSQWPANEVKEALIYMIVCRKAAKTQRQAQVVSG
jgi:hypothetical protein